MADASNSKKIAPKKEIAEEIHWSSLEYQFTEKTNDWFWIFGTIAVLLIIISIILDNYLFGLIILLSTIILGYYSKQPPLIIDYGLVRSGVKYGEIIYPYETIKSFWVDKKTRHLIIETSRMLKPHISIPIGEADPEIIRGKLLPILREEEFDGTLSEFITEFFGF